MKSANVLAISFGFVDERKSDIEKVRMYPYFGDRGAKKVRQYQRFEKAICDQKSKTQTKIKVLLVMLKSANVQ